MNARRLGCTAIGFILLVGALTAQQNFAKDQLLQRAQQILAEEQRQHYIGQKLAGVAKDFRGLIDDLDSNGLLKSGQAKELLGAVGTLETVGNDHIKKAREHLRLGRQQLDNPAHLKNAHDEIEMAVQKLNTLVQLAGSLEKTEKIRDQIKQLAKEQEKILTDTKKLAKEMLQGSKIPEAAHKALAEAQKGVAERAKDLQSELKEAQKGLNPEQKSRLEKATDVLQDKKLEGNLNAAAANLENKNPLSAAEQQKQALDALKEIGKLLESPANQPPTQLAKADPPTQGEKTQREKGDQPDKADPKKGDQPEKGDPTKGDPTKGDPSAKGDPMKGDPMKGDPSGKGEPKKGDQPDKGNPMKGDPKEGGKGEPKKGDRKEGGKGDPKKGDQPGRGEPKKGDQPGKDGKDGKDGEGKDGKDGKGKDGMGEGEGEGKGKGKGKGKGEGEGEGEGEGKGKGKGKGKGMGEGEGEGEGDGPPKDGEGKGKAEGKGGKSGGQVTDKNKGVAPDEGQRDFIKTAPRDGGAFNRDSSRWSSMSERERAALIERYLRELPLEYRELLRSYYQNLAK